jgi:Tol biopolymer transport system component
MKKIAHQSMHKLATILLLFGFLFSAWTVGSSRLISASKGEAEGVANGRIVFSSGFDIYTMNPDGSQPTRLTYSGAGEFNVQPTWSPDHSKIAFVSNRSGGNVDLYVMHADGSMVQRLTDNPGEDSQPAWSPDGSRIAFVHGDDPSYAGRINLLNCETAHIYVMKADGTGQKKLTTVGNNTDPAWSPDSQQIAFSSNRDMGNDSINYEIYRMNDDGGNPVRLTYNEVEDADPAWSTDGSRLAYGSGYERINFFCGIDGIIQNPRGPASVIDASGGEIYVMNIDGTGNVQLTITKDNNDPAWSPDGSQIVFASRRDGNFELYSMNAEGEEQKRLTDNQLGDLSPSWSPLLMPPNHFSDLLKANRPH